MEETHVEKYFAVRVTRIRTDTTTVYVKVRDGVETHPADVAKEFLQELGSKKPVDYENKLDDVATELRAYQCDTRAIDIRTVDVTV